MFVVLMAVVGVGCAKKNPASAPKPGTQSPDETITQFVTQETDSGRVQWKLAAPRALRYNARNVFMLDSPTIEFFDDMGNLQTTLTAKNGEYSLLTHDMLAYGDVVATSTKGEVLETDTLRYLNETDKIVSDSHVKLTRGRDVITGIGMECDHTLDSVDIKRNMRARIVEEDGKFDGLQ
ncbi:MAG TPA: LPS export ABC transporter periplasmic protein LptC [Candidatus Krumholzibacteria bacterium]|nr:LPS export ABC transporter periplasmic protein LptC [Candidatus Krumholzibacteria bacterium]